MHCYLVDYPNHAFSEQVKYCFFLQYFDMFVEQTKEIMFQKWKTVLTVPPDLDLWPECSIP